MSNVVVWDFVKYVIYLLMMKCCQLWNICKWLIAINDVSSLDRKNLVYFLRYHFIIMFLDWDLRISVCVTLFRWSTRKMSHLILKRVSSWQKKGIWIMYACYKRNYFTWEFDYNDMRIKSCPTESKNWPLIRWHIWPRGLYFDRVITNGISKRF